MSAWIPVLALTLLVEQNPAASLTGLVRDAQNGAPVAGATVAIADLGRGTTSGEDGRYLLPRVPAGPQHLEVRRIGYAPRTLHAFVPPVGQVEIHISLAPEPVPIPGLTVAPPVAARGAEMYDGSAHHPDLSLSAEAMRNHPMLAEPDAFAALAGGVVVAEPEAPRGLHVRGGREDQVTYLLDGIPVLSPYHSVGLFSAWNPDALARLRLEASPSGAAAPDALSGVVSAETRRPGIALAARGAVSTSQVRATLDGPLPQVGGGFLLSVRRGFPGVPAPESEYSYVRGWSEDWFAKVEGDLLGGEWRLLAYGNRNRSSAASAVTASDALDVAPAEPDHRFGWEGRSLGGEWSRSLSRTSRVRVRGWHATADAAARWVGGEGYPLRVGSARRDAGVAAVLELGDSATVTSLGLRGARSRTRYHVRDGSVRPALQASALVVAAHVEHSRALSRTFRLETGLVGAVYGEDAWLASRAEVRWSPRESVDFAVQAARTYQAEQSLLNSESAAAYLFPATLSVGRGAPGVPLARSDRLSLAAEVRPGPGARLGGELYARAFHGLLLVAPVTARPFAIDRFAVGSGSASGAALEFSVARARYAVLGTYSFVRARYLTGDSAYRPTFAATHSLEAGVLAFPRSTLSVRAGLTGVFGRRATALVGPFEWEACNLLDLGCEFAGSPDEHAEPLGATRLPAYLRLDVGARKHWHLDFAGTDGQIGLYASVTNVLGRRNLLTRTLDPLSGDWTWVEMRSRVPLVIGLDWRF